MSSFKFRILSRLMNPPKRGEISLFLLHRVVFYFAERPLVVVPLYLSPLLVNYLTSGLVYFVRPAGKRFLGWRWEGVARSRKNFFQILRR